MGAKLIGQKPRDPDWVEREMARMDAEVARARERFGPHSSSAMGPDGRMAVDHRSPLDELMEREEEGLRAAEEEALARAFVGRPGALPDWVRAEVKAAVWQEFQGYENALMEWIFAAGPHPLHVLRRLFAYAKHKRASLLWNMGFRALGSLLGESHENMRLLCVSLFGETPAGWKKDGEARARMRAAAMGNKNRLGGARR